MLFDLSSFWLLVVVAGILFGATGIGIAIGRAIGPNRSRFREPLNIMQAALIGLVALLLAFGLTMAVDRYQSRRENVVVEATSIETTYLRAQTLAEPLRACHVSAWFVVACRALVHGVFGMNR